MLALFLSLSFSHIHRFPQGRRGTVATAGWERADRTTNNTEREWRTSERPRRREKQATVRRDDGSNGLTATARIRGRYAERRQTYERTYERPNERASDSLTPPRFASTRTHLSMSNAHLGGSSALTCGGDARAYGRTDWPPRCACRRVCPIAVVVTTDAAAVACRHQHPPAVT